VNRNPNLKCCEDQQLLGNAQTFSWHDEVPMAGTVRVVMFATVLMVAFVIAAAMIGVIMVSMVTHLPMRFLVILLSGLCSFDMDVWNVISRMAVPQGGVGPRHRTCIEQ
jgi:hypothetical protein